jgi:hypothetical protein
MNVIDGFSGNGTALSAYEHGRLGLSFGGAGARCRLPAGGTVQQKAAGLGATARRHAQAAQRAPRSPARAPVVSRPRAARAPPRQPPSTATFPFPPGFLILYYVGVVQVLQQLGITAPGQPSPPVAGISSGALTAGVICSGISADTFQETVRGAARRRGRGEGVRARRGGAGAARGCGRGAGAGGRSAGRSPRAGVRAGGGGRGGGGRMLWGRARLSETCRGRDPP